MKGRAGGGPYLNISPHPIAKMGTLGGFPNPPATGSGERSSPEPTRSVGAQGRRSGSARGAQDRRGALRIGAAAGRSGSGAGRSEWAAGRSGSALGKHEVELLLDLVGVGGAGDGELLHDEAARGVEHAALAE